ncbi:hypothetical protein EYE40_04130 [Glaciihabitans arcticus]|uniref:Pilus assembly protein CpaE n=1 Tax=Glaciihabitans arcticus TaxID=2668039 RepID=A0A4Q9GWN5_9MICO|nr:hypothetical protein [Glaciihabitans arcticus]TBN56650.1 hypothetical protein EYE40_04130 [Glaciihabitans arcticus]
MISRELARNLASAGVRWTPASGDAFCIDGPEFDGDVFTLSDMTIEAHEFDTGTILGFNGTTEWALDSVALEAALWLPREDQLRELLGGTFRSLTLTDGVYQVDIVLPDATSSSLAADAAEAYGLALLRLVRGD